MTFAWFVRSDAASIPRAPSPPVINLFGCHAGDHSLCTTRIIPTSLRCDFGHKGAADVPHFPSPIISPVLRFTFLQLSLCLLLLKGQAPLHVLGLYHALIRLCKIELAKWPLKMLSWKTADCRSPLALCAPSLLFSRSESGRVTHPGRPEF